MDSEQETQAPAATEGDQPSNESESSAENALEYSELTVGVLKEKLKELGLPISGKKSDLVERLTASDQKETDQSLDIKKHHLTSDHLCKKICCFRSFPSPP